MKTFEDLVKHLHFSKQAHTATYWTGLVGAIILVINAILAGTNTGYQISPSSQDTIIGITAIVVTLILGGHYSAGKIAAAVSQMASVFAQNNAPATGVVATNPAPVTATVTGKVNP